MSDLRAAPTTQRIAQAILLEGVVCACHYVCLFKGCGGICGGSPGPAAPHSARALVGQRMTGWGMISQLQPSMPASGCGAYTAWQGSGVNVRDIRRGCRNARSWTIQRWKALGARCTRTGAPSYCGNRCSCAIAGSPLGVWAAAWQVRPRPTWCSGSHREGYPVSSHSGAVLLKEFHGALTSLLQMVCSSE